MKKSGLDGIATRILKALAHVQSLVFIWKNFFNYSLTVAMYVPKCWKIKWASHLFIKVM